MARYIPDEQKPLETLKQMLDERYQRWNELYTNGGADPCWSDGVNLNLVRNHIIHYKQLIKLRLKEDAEGEEQISFFAAPKIAMDNRPLPPEVSDSYMAQPDKIRADARRTLEALQADPDVKFVMRLAPLDKAGERTLYLSAFRNNLCHLIEYLKRDDLVALRRYRATDYWLQSFWEKAQQIRQYQAGKIKPRPEADEDEYEENEEATAS